MNTYRKTRIENANIPIMTDIPDKARNFVFSALLNYLYKLPNQEHTHHLLDFPKVPSSSVFLWQTFLNKVPGCIPQLNRKTHLVF